MSSPSLPDASLRASTLHLPAGPWSTVLDCLCARFPAIDRDTWLARMQRGRVLDAEGRALGPQAAYREGLRVHYFRELPVEAPIPFEARILYRDEHLLVADKPHFLPVMPAGGYVEQTLLARLARSTGNRDLVPLHRIDRHTAGLVLFSTNPGSRGRYQALFRERRIDKCYEAIAPALPQLDFPLLRRTRLVPGEPFFRMREGEGEPNSETRIEVVERNGRWWRYRLYPVTGKKHQLRVHLAALGAGIQNDGFYPELLDAEGSPDDYLRPLKLLARGLRFDDPLSGERRTFESGLRLDWQVQATGSPAECWRTSPTRSAWRVSMNRRSAWRAARASRRIARWCGWTRPPERARVAQGRLSSLTTRRSCSTQPRLCSISLPNSALLISSWLSQLVFCTSR